MFLHKALKNTLVSVLLIVCMVTATSMPAAAGISMIVDGVQLESDAAPVNVNNRVLVPVRPLFEAFGATLHWNEQTRTATAATLETTVVITIGAMTAEVNASELKLDVPAQIIDDRTYMPARFVAEAFGATVSWDNARQQVVVTGGPLARGATGGAVSLPPSAPLTVSVATDENDPVAQVRAAIANLTTPYVQEIADIGFDPKQAFNIDDFPGVQGWSCEWKLSETGDKLTLTWTFEWADDYAIVMAYHKPALENKLSAEQKAVTQKCRSIISQKIKPAMSDYEKQKAIHDYLALNCQYDSAAAKNPDAAGRESFSAYGALINGIAVCQGYAEAAQILLAMVGIEGYRLNSEDHSWNLIRLGDGYYHMDVTWDDPVPDQPGKVSYDYFNLTDEQIILYKSHDWNNKEDYPAAKATKYNYFVYNGLVANNVDEVKQKLTAAFRSGADEVTLWIADNRTGAYDWNTDLQFLFGLMAGSGKGFGYVPPGEDRDTLTVSFR